MGKDWKENTMKTLKCIVISLQLCLCLISCEENKSHNIFDLNKQQRLEYALDFSNQNRDELVKVLDHYAGDSLKLKAAEYLIINMIGLKSVKQSTFPEIHKIISAHNGDGYTFPKASKEKIELLLTVPKDTIWDLQTLSAEYLIDNIELSFKVWKECRWNQNLSFEYFCEYILPYRIGEEPISNWRSVYYEHFKLPDSLRCLEDPLYAAEYVISLLKDIPHSYNGDIQLPRFGAKYLIKKTFGTCQTYCDLTLYAMRSVGLPVAIDMYPFSPEFRVDHVWNVLFDIRTGKWLPFWFLHNKPERNNYSDGRKKGKVYRNQFSIQEHSPYPDLTNYRMKDVTSDYFGENNVEFTYNTKQRPEKSIPALGVFGGQGQWVAIMLGELNSTDKVIFYNLEPFVIYLPFFQTRQNRKPITYPFMLVDSNVDSLRLFQPQREVESIVVKRKYPLRENVLKWRKSLKHINVEAYSPNDIVCFSHEIKAEITNNRYIINIGEHVLVQTIRLNIPNTKRFELAELCIFDLNQERVAFNSVTSSRKINKDVDFYDPNRLIDNDPLTYYFSEHLGETLTLKLSKPTNISKILVIPRNDDNYIRIGDKYELFYHNGIGGWQTLGSQVANSDSLIFAEVPKGSLLWLRNKTRGREEQVFYYEHNHQIFVHEHSR